MTIPGFLSKTYDIFTNKEFENICGWGARGETIIIKKIEEFSKSVLPRYFKHSNFQSFVRQLNMYDFHKTVQDPSHGEFSHEFFRKDRPDLLHNIKRKANYREQKDKSKGRVVYGTGNTTKSRNSSAAPPLESSDVLYTDTVTAESDALLQELVQQRMVRDDMEKRLKQLESNEDVRDKNQKIIQGENLMLKKMVTEARQTQFIMQDKMERMMKCLYNAYSRGQVEDLPPGNRMISDRAYKSVTNMGSSFHDVCGFLQLESPVARSAQATPGLGPQTTQALNSLISPPITTNGSVKTRETYRFDNEAAAVAAPLGFAGAGDAVIPLVELPETPAVGSDAESTAPADVSSSSSSSSSKRGSTKRKASGDGLTPSSTSSSPHLTQKEAEEMLTLDTEKEELTYADFLKRARVQADSVTQAATEALSAKTGGAGASDVPTSAVFKSLKESQDATMSRMDSLESTLDAFMLLDDQDECDM